MTWWTTSKVEELRQTTDNHVDCCDECQLCIEYPEDHTDYCEIGLNLLDLYLEADMEYSWQHNTRDGDYSELCPCNKCFVKTMRISAQENSPS